MRTLTRVRARMALTVLKICCAGDASTAFLSRILTLSSRILRVFVSTIIDCEGC